MNFDDFVGLPYREAGRGPDTYDCYGLVAAVLKVARGVSLPDWHTEAAGTQAASRAISEALRGEVAEGRSVRVDKPVDFDIAIIGSALRPHHIGVVVEDGVLHASRTFGSAWHQLGRFLTIYPHTEFYRWHP